jgi:hypothetical protein
LVEQRIENPRVAGSIPAPGTISFHDHIATLAQSMRPAFDIVLRAVFTKPPGVLSEV